MGLSFARTDPSAQGELRDAGRILGCNGDDLLAGTAGSLDRTRTAQPAIVVASLIAYRTLLRHVTMHPSAFAGLSLGEWSALGAAGVYDFKTLLHLVQVRAEAMDVAAAASRGTMAAVFGIEPGLMLEICTTASTPEETVVAANWNCPGQIVISGHAEAVARASSLARESGAKRIIPLNVAGAFHTVLMEPAAERMKEELRLFVPNGPSAPVFSNVTAAPHEESGLTDFLVRQIVSPVLFEATIRNMVAAGITHFLEIGPGATLSGFVKKIAPECPVTHLGEAEELDAVKGWLVEHGMDQ
jgi:[acyl-carrier-protein] S-malonyltransferase